MSSPGSVAASVPRSSTTEPIPNSEPAAFPNARAGTETSRRRLPMSTSVIVTVKDVVSAKMVWVVVADAMTNRLAAAASTIAPGARSGARAAATVRSTALAQQARATTDTHDLLARPDLIRHIPIRHSVVTAHATLANSTKE